MKVERRTWTTGKSGICLHGLCAFFDSKMGVCFVTPIFDEQESADVTMNKKKITKFANMKVDMFRLPVS